MVTFRKVIRMSDAECMSCGKEGCRYMDSDGSTFCSKVCVFGWHGDDVKEK